MPFQSVNYWRSVARLAILFTVLALPWLHSSADNSISSSIKKIYQQHLPIPLSFSPDGEYLLLRNCSSDTFELTVISRKNFEVIYSHRSSQFQETPRWANDSRRISFFSDIDGNQRFKLFIVNIQDGKVRDIPIVPTTLARSFWSPDDTSIAYVVQERSQLNLHVVNVASQLMPSLRVLSGLSRLGGISWSTDSKWLAAVKKTASSYLQIININNGAQKSIQFGGEIGSITWSPVSQKIAVAARDVREDYQKLFMIDVSTQAIAPIQCFEDAEITALTFTPDEKALIISRSENGHVSQSVCDLKNSLQFKIYSKEGRTSLLGFDKVSGNPFVATSENLNRARRIELVNIINRQRSKVLHYPDSFPDFTVEDFAIPRKNMSDIPAFLWHNKDKNISKQKILIMVHGGPQLQYYKSREPEIDICLNNGISVLQLNYHGSSGYGAKFATQAQAVENDVVAVIKFLNKSYGVPIDHVFLWGDSFGAKPSILAAEHFKEDLGGLIILSYLGGMEGRSVKPKNLLVFHGENDFVITPDKALLSPRDRWFITENQPTWWNLIRREGHTFHRQETWVNVWERIVRFVRHLS